MGALGLPVAVYQAFKNFSPHLEDEATVEVVGQPGASKRQLYFLALSACFGLVKRIDVGLKNGGKNDYLFPPPGMLMIEYDAASNWVRATVRYRTSMLQATIADIIDDPVGGVSGIRRPGGGGGFETTANFDDVRRLPVYAGPACELVGQPFEFTNATPIGPGIPESSVDDLAPRLPFAGKTILTTCAQVADPDPTLPAIVPGAIIASPNPKPPGDNRSRGAVVGGRSVRTDVTGGVGSIGGGTTAPGGDDCCRDKSLMLVPLVFAALADPGSAADAVFKEPQSGPLGS